MSLQFYGKEIEFVFLNFLMDEELGPTREITINMRTYYHGKYEFLPAHTDLFVSSSF